MGAFSGGTGLTVSRQTNGDGLTNTVKLTYTPTNSTFNGTLSVTRAADGTLVEDGTGTALQPLPAGAVVSGLPQTLTFDGTGAPRSVTITITAPSGTSSTTYYGIRLNARYVSGDTADESVVLLQFLTNG